MCLTVHDMIHRLLAILVPLQASVLLLLERCTLQVWAILVEL